MAGSQRATSAPHPQKKNTKNSIAFSPKMYNFAGE